MKIKLAFPPALLVLACFSFVARADIISTYGDVVVDGSQWRITADSTGIGYGGLEVQITNPLTPATLSNLSANYQMTAGTFGGGAPRFTLFDNSFNSAWLYWGTPVGGGTFTDPYSGSPGNTGNLANLVSPSLYVASNGFGGYSAPNTYVTYSTFVGLTGATPISYVTLDLDGGSFGPKQQMLIDNFTINDQVYNATVAPEPGYFVLVSGGLGVLGWTYKRKQQKLASKPV